MRALCWHGKGDVRVEQVPDPEILNPRDIILKISLTAICGSDLHLYDGYIPTMRPGDIIGHEFMGEVVETGKAIDAFDIGDRVVVPFPIACGNCHYCTHDLHALCDNSNPNAWMLEKAYGYAAAGIYGYSHLYGGYAGGQAEYVRVPFADAGPMKIDDGLSDEQVLFLTDIYPTGYQAAKACDIEEGDVIAVWGCGPVGQFAIRSAQLLGADRVLAIDRVPERLRLAEEAGAEPFDYADVDVLERIKQTTNGRGPDACIDAVGLESHGFGAMAWYDKAKHTTRMQTGRPTALREVIQACGKGGTVSIPGVYGGFIDKMPMGAAFGKGLTFKMGQTHVQRYLPELLGYIRDGAIDPTSIISHRMPLDDAPRGYEIFREKWDNCTKVVLQP